MRKNFGAKPLLYPQPVFIIAAYDEKGKPNAMNAAWGGVADANKIMICISPGHKTTKNILFKKEFTVSMGTADQVAACDYVGIVSGNDVEDKLEKAGFHTVKAEFVDAPLIEELPMAIECKLVSYDTQEDILIGEVVNVNADESILNENGKVDVSRLRPIVFDAMNSAYCVIGEKVGNAFKDGMTLK